MYDAYGEKADDIVGQMGVEGPDIVYD